MCCRIKVLALNIFSSCSFCTVTSSSSSDKISVISLVSSASAEFWSLDISFHSSSPSSKTRKQHISNVSLIMWALHSTWWQLTSNCWCRWIRKRHLQTAMFHCTWLRGLVKSDILIVISLAVLYSKIGRAEKLPGNSKDVWMLWLKYCERKIPFNVLKSH